MSRHARSHPPTLLTVARKTLQHECGVQPGHHVLAAVSGGRDSMALLHVLAKLSRDIGFSVAAHGVDHGYRKGAARELDAAEAFAEKLGVPFTRTKEVKARSARESNVQEQARIVRYAELEHVLGGSRWDPGSDATRLLATAHHADDRAETVLIRILRGASGAGLAVLPPRLGTTIRPFIRATRDAIDRHVARHHIPYSDDPSNEDPRYLRTRVRREVIPLLRQLSPGIVAHLCGIADDVAELRHDGGVFPRVIRDALRSLEATGNVRARIALPGGRVARFDAAQSTVVIEEDARQARRGRARKREEG